MTRPITEHGKTNTFVIYLNDKEQAVLRAFAVKNCIPMTTIIKACTLQFIKNQLPFAQAMRNSLHEDIPNENIRLPD